jgi:hypothetical protein
MEHAGMTGGCSILETLLEAVPTCSKKSTDTLELVEACLGLAIRVSKDDTKFAG